MSAVANGAMICKDGVLRVQCVSEFYEAQIQILYVVLIRRSSTVSASIVWLQIWPAFYIKGRGYSRGRDQSNRIIMATLFYKCLVVCYATEYMQRCRFSRGKVQYQQRMCLLYFEKFP